MSHVRKEKAVMALISWQIWVKTLSPKEKDCLNNKNKSETNALTKDVEVAGCFAIERSSIRSGRQPENP
jgi:hypothetical protein